GAIPGLSAGPGGRSYPGGPGAGSMPGTPGAYGSGAGSYESGGGAYEMGYDLAGMYGQGMMAEKKNVDVAAGISVRMVIDLQKQRNMLRDALHLSGNYLEAQQYIQYVDLLVERRQRIDGTGAWGEWEEVKSEDLGEILEESLGIDRDIVSPAVTRNTITMPLPRRAAGVWQPSEASHPRVEDFELSAEEKALIDKWNQMVKERQEEEKKDAPVVVETKGFSKFVQSATDVGSSMYGSSGMMGMSGSSGYESGNYESMYSAYESQMGQGAKLTAEQRELLDETRATAEHRLLLVRFMDFTMERGHSYQYRARVEMKNPNYDHPIDELEDPALGIEPTLVSDWSQPTAEIFMPVAHHMYLTDVTSRPGDQEVVGVKIYTDTTETGLPVMGDIKVLMGMPVAGVRSLEVVDLRSNVLEASEITLKTNELLAAAEKTERLSTSDHPELRPAIDHIQTLLGRGAKPIPDQICVVDSNGHLKLRSVGDRSDDEKKDDAEAAFILKQYDAWKPKAATGGNNFFGESGGSYEGGGSAYGLGMEAGAASFGGYYGGGEDDSGRRKSSRAERRDRRSGKSPGPGVGGAYGSP
ncbi:MAG: hypothetical protein KDA89_14280, partial [Planctomycetaceae bacterium]|nr:hypothetical protein [Planctomycetaceae bacterium]